MVSDQMKITEKSSENYGYHFILKPGTWYIGDPYYALNGDVYDALMDMKWNQTPNLGNQIIDFDLEPGRAIIFNTQIGDGRFWFDCGPHTFKPSTRHTLPVDSGMLSFISANAINKRNHGGIEITLTSPLGILIDGRSNVCSDDGYLVIVIADCDGDAEEDN